MAVEDRLREATGLGLRDLALRTVTDGDRCVQLHGARVAAVPISSGQGVISGFSRLRRGHLQHLGCDAWMTTQPDVRGIQAAIAAGAQVVFLADDHRFIALNVTKGCSADDDPATADGYVTALEAAARRPRGPRGAACSAWARSAAPPRAGWRRAARPCSWPSRTRSASRPPAPSA